MVSMEEKNYIVEAKQTYPSISLRSRKSISNLEHALSQAVRDAKESLAKGSLRIGLVFVVPYLPNDEKEDVNKRISQFQSQLLKESYDLLTWQFPLSTRKLPWKDGLIYPGVILAGRVHK